MKRSSTTIAISSGKGGVGKSVVAVNLAETLAASDHRVALLDLDLGQGACSVLLNEAPAARITDLLHHTVTTDQVLHQTDAGLTLVEAAAEPGDADTFGHRLYEVLDDLLTRLRATHEYVLIDTPAGTDGPVRWALDRADMGLLVVVGEPTAVADAYRLAKLVWQADANYPLATVVNFADTETDARSVAGRFGHVTEHFTGQVPNYLGWVPFSAHVRQSVRDQRPAAREEGPLQDAFKEIAYTLVHGRTHALQTAI